MRKTSRTNKSVEEIEKMIAEIVSEEGAADARKELATLIEYRRGPQGRIIVVPHGAPGDLRALSVDELVRIRGLYDSKRKAKRKQYLKLKGDSSYKGPRVVAEGDSYFEHPC